MSWVTVIWSMVASACLTLAAVHFVVWTQARAKWGYVLFALTALAVAAMAGCELWLMRAQTPAQYLGWLRWYHVSVWVIVLAMVGFVRMHLRAGRPWLAWSVCGLRTFALLLNFLVAENLNYRDLVGLRQVRFLGEVVSAPEGVANPWMLVGQLSVLLLVAFVVDAGIAAWRRGDGPLALATTSSIAFFALAGTVQGAAVVSGVLQWPVATSLAFLGVVVVIACDLAGKALRAGRLTDALGESEARYRGLLDGAIEGLFQTSPAGKLLMANPALARMLGYASVAEVVATITDSAAQVWVDPAERSRLLELLEAQGTVRGYECQFRRKDGTSIWVSLSSQAVRGPDGRVHRFEGFAEDVTERRRTRDALLAGEARLISAVDAAGLGFYEAEVDGRLCFLDERVRELLGIPLGEESRGRDYWLNHIHPEDLPGVLEKSQGLLAGRLTQVDGEYRYRHPSRGLLWIHHRSRVLARDASGRMVRLLGVLQDITERKEAEEALKRVSHQNALILGAAAEGIIGLDLQGKHTFVSPAAASMLGYAPEDLLGRDSHSLWHHSNKHGSPYPKDECPICASYREGATRHVSSEVFWRQDGTCFPVDYRCTPIGEHGSTLGAVLTFEDITSRRKAEEALRTSQARLASGVELAGLGFYEMVEGEDVIYTDDRMRSVCGLPPDAARGVPAARFWLEHIHPDDQRRILDADQRLGDGRLDRISAEYRYLHPDGHERWLHHLAVVSRRDSAGQPAHTRGVVRDITEQKRVEQELARQRLQLAHVARVSTMGQLASSLAHELNQPLGAILRNAEAAELLLANPSPDIAELQAILADIRGDDHRAGEVIDRLRAFLKRREIERHPVDFGSLASETITLVRPDAERRGVRLGLQAGAPLRPVLGDRVQLQQVLLNLLLNAMDAVEGKPRGERRVSVRIRSMDAVIEVSVEDNGPGIPADAIQRVFEPFYTSKPHGLGMGLSIARGIVETHGGRLRVENSPDGGATFTFTLPAGSE